MNNFKWQSSELEWVERVRQLCVEIARAALADLPKLPENLSQKTLPLAEQGREILDAAQNWGISERSQYPQLEWVDRVCQFFLELSRLSLSEHFRLPDHLSQRSLDLAEEAQDIQEAFETAMGKAAPEGILDFQPSIETSIPPHQDSLNADLNADRSPGLLLELLRKSVKIQWANSSHPDAQEWQQLINLLDIANSLYLRVKE